MYLTFIITKPDFSAIGPDLQSLITFENRFRMGKSQRRAALTQLLGFQPPLECVCSNLTLFREEDENLDARIAIYSFEL